MEPVSKKRTRRCEYCGTSERRYTDLLDHYFAHFLLQDFRSQHPRLNTSPEKLLELKEFKDFLRGLKLPCWRNASSEFVARLTSLAIDLSVLPIVQLLKDHPLSVIRSEAAPSSFTFSLVKCIVEIIIRERRKLSIAMPWRHKKNQSKLIDNVILSCRESECNYVSIYPTQLMIHYELHELERMGLLSDSSLLARQVKVDSSTARHIPTSDATRRKLSLPFSHWRMLNRQLGLYQIRNPQAPLGEYHDEFKWDALMYWKDAIQQYQSRHNWITYDQLRQKIVKNNRFLIINLMYKSSINPSEDAIINTFGKETFPELSTTFPISELVFNQSVSEKASSRPARRETDRANPPVKTPNIPASKPLVTVQSNSISLKCDICPERFHKMRMILSQEDLEIHNKLWHDEKYQAETCYNCQFRALNRTLMTQLHTKAACKAWLNDGIFIQMGTAGRTGRRSGNKKPADSENKELEPPKKIPKTVFSTTTTTTTTHSSGDDHDFASPAPVCNPNAHSTVGLNRTTIGKTTRPLTIQDEHVNMYCPLCFNSVTALESHFEECASKYNFP